MKEDESTPEYEIPESVDFYHIKMPDYRVIYVEGAIGGLTPRGNISMTVFSERHPTPERSTFNILRDGSLGDEDETKRVTKAGIVRDCHATLIFDAEAAERMIRWLQSIIEKMERMEAAKVALNKKLKDQKEAGDDTATI